MQSAFSFHTVLFCSLNWHPQPCRQAEDHASGTYWLRSDTPSSSLRAMGVLGFGRLLVATQGPGPGPAEL